MSSILSKSVTKDDVWAILLKSEVPLSMVHNEWISDNPIPTLCGMVLGVKTLTEVDFGLLLDQDTFKCGRSTTLYFPHGCGSASLSTHVLPL